MSQMYINIEKYMELSQNLRRCRAGSWQMDWFLVSVIFHQKMLQTKCSFQDLATGISFKNPTACVLSTLIKQLCKPSVPLHQAADVSSDTNGRSQSKSDRSEKPEIRLWGSGGMQSETDDSYVQSIQYNIHFFISSFISSQDQADIHTN